MGYSFLLTALVYGLLVAVGTRFVGVFFKSRDLKESANAFGGVIGFITAIFGAFLLHRFGWWTLLLAPTVATVTVGFVLAVIFAVLVVALHGVRFIDTIANRVRLARSRNQAH